MEAAGSVIDVGEGVHGLLPGDRVAYLGPVPGAYCGVRNVPASWLVPLPAAIDDETAAAVLLKGLTADYLLRDLGHVRPRALAGTCCRRRGGAAVVRLGAPPGRHRDRHRVQ